MKIKIIFEDEALLVIDKPAGILVHPTEGQQQESLVDWLGGHYPALTDQDWPDEQRPGIVHRLDRDTSGLLILAKNPAVLLALQADFAAHKIEKVYQALVLGKVEPEQGTITAPLGRQRADRSKRRVTYFTLNSEKTRSATTHYRAIARYQFQKGALTMLELRLETGRTHQLRVHLNYQGWPIIGDPEYSTKPSRQISKRLGLERQFLHAVKITFAHPVTKKGLTFTSPLPTELEEVLAQLERG